MGKKGAGLAVDELNFLQNRLGLGAGFNPDLFKQAAPTQQGLGTPEDEAALRAQLLASFGQGQTGAATNQAGIQDIIQRLIGVQTGAAGQPNLANLDPAAQSSLNAITQANQEALNLQQQEARNQLTQNLFGSGTAQSTIALDQAGRLNFGQGQLQSQLLSDAAQRELGLRTDVSNRALQSLGLQGNILGTAGGLQVNAGELGGRDAALRAQLLEGAFGRGLTRDVTSAGFTENERQRAFNQDQFRQSLLSNLGSQTAGQQATRVGPLPAILNAGLSLASAAIPGGGALGGSLLSKIPGISKLLKPATTATSGANPIGQGFYRA